MDELQIALKDAEIHSFWGHRNTLSVACDYAGVDLWPDVDRPVLTLSPELIPCLGGTTFHTCWVLSPNYRESFRPSVGEEVEAENINSWQVLCIQWMPPDA